MKKCRKILCKVGRGGTEENIIRRMRIACWIPKATDTHSQYEHLLLIHWNNDYTNAPQCYVKSTLRVLFITHYKSIMKH